MWKMKYIFWESPYWGILVVRNAIDVMHLTRNLCLNVLGFLGCYKNSKDTLEARQDLKNIHRNEAPPIEVDEEEADPEEVEEEEQDYLGLPSYTLSKEDKDIMFDCLNSMKVPSGYSSNIKGIISMKDKKFTNLKAHDCHMLMTQLLLVALRGVLPEKVRLALIKLCAFLNAISQKAIDPRNLVKLQNYVVQCLSFELAFPPSFFDIMTHLLVHLVKEINILGPVYLHNMWPFERFMSVLKNLKKYVLNRTRPEGSIAKGYVTEEAIEFCVDFVDSIDSNGVPVSRHKGRLLGKGTIGRKACFNNDTDLFNKAHLGVMQQSTLVTPYIEEHKQIISSQNPTKTEAWVTRHHLENFPSWLSEQVIGDSTIHPQLALLARGPSSTIVKFQAYDINDYTFYTRDQD
jgi:hypothetical protein